MSIVFALCIILVLLIIFLYRPSLNIIMGIILICYTCSGKDNIKIIGGASKNKDIRVTTIWHNPSNFDINNYKQYYWMTQKTLKYANQKHTKDYEKNMHMLLSHQPSKNKWGNTDGESPSQIIKYKFSEQILNPMHDKIDRVKSPQYLDYGCGDGAITHALRNIFNAKSFCIDINDYRKYKSSAFVCNNNINTIDTYFTNETLDIISAVQSLHHVSFDINKNQTSNMFESTVSTILRQFYAKLKPNGLLLIREHDVQELSHLYPVLFEHMVYEMLEYKQPINNINIFVKKFIQDYHKKHNGWYFSRQYLHNQLEALGFKLLHFEWKKGNNVSRIYNALYVKSP